MTAFLFFTTMILSVHANAFVFDTNAFYFSDKITATEDSGHDTMYFDVLLGFDLDKKGMYQVGWNYSSHSSTTDNDGDEITYKTTTQMGPGLVAYLNKSRSLRFGFAYNYKLVADYKANAGSEEEWRGTSMVANFGYQIRFDSAFSLGLRFNYVSATIEESINTADVKDDVSHKKTIIYPSIAFTIDDF
jgi:hypothetical protein